jgi:hypothetical protein
MCPSCVPLPAPTYSPDRFYQGAFGQFAAGGNPNFCSLLGALAPILPDRDKMQAILLLVRSDQGCARQDRFDEDQQGKDQEFQVLCWPI